MAHGGSFSMPGYSPFSEDLAFDMKSMSLQAGPNPNNNPGVHLQNVFHANPGARGAAAAVGGNQSPANMQKDQFMSMLGLHSPQQQQSQQQQFSQYPGFHQQQQQPKYTSPQQHQQHQFHQYQQQQFARQQLLQQQQMMAQQQQSRIARPQQQQQPTSPGAPIQRAPGTSLSPSMAPGPAASPTTQNSSALSASASEFVPVFRKPEKKLVLYSFENFKRKSNSDDAMAINQVKQKMVELLKNPRNIEDTILPVVDTVKSWSTDIITFHQIVEDVFEFSVDDNNRLPNNGSFIPIGCKVLNILVKTITPIEGNKNVTFFDTLVHKCCREFDNCIKLDHTIPANANRIRNIALIIGGLFNTIKEGEMRVYLFAEQVTNLCLILVQVRTPPAVAKMAHGGSFSMPGYSPFSEDLAFDMKSMSLQAGPNPNNNPGVHLQNVFHANPGARGAAAAVGGNQSPANMQKDQFMSMLGLHSPQQQQSQQQQFSQYPGFHQQQQQPKYTSPQQHQQHQFHQYQQQPFARQQLLQQQQMMAQQQQSRIARPQQQQQPTSPGAPIQRAPGTSLSPSMAPGPAASPTTQNSSALSASASEFVPVFRKPEKKLVLYSFENFKRKSNSDDAMAINQVKQKMVELLKNPRNIEDTILPVVDTVKSWSTDIITFHQIVEDVFEFSVDDNNRLPNNGSFIPIGCKVLNILVKTITPIEGNKNVTFFDTLVHKCCREFDNCIKLDHTIPANANRIRNIALIIGGLFNTIKEGEMRVYLFAEQVTNLCLILVQVRTPPALEAVAKILLASGGDLRCLVEEIRFSIILQHLQNAAQNPQLNSKTKAMLDDIMALNANGWKTEHHDPDQPDQFTGGRSGNKLQKSWSTGSDDCAPVTNPGDWNDYATDEYDEDVLAQMLKFEEEDDFSDVEEDFNKFMEEAARKFKN
eukprot:sb/3461794/